MIGTKTEKNKKKVLIIERDNRFRKVLKKKGMKEKERKENKNVSMLFFVSLFQNRYRRNSFERMVKMAYRNI